MAPYWVNVSFAARDCGRGVARAIEKQQERVYVDSSSRAAEVQKWWYLVIHCESLRV